MNQKMDLYYSPASHTSINENVSAPIMIFPNASSDFIMINNIGDYTYNLTIYNTNGQEILKTKVNENQLVNISELRSGIYG